jgi:hypothetical protein
MESQHEEEEFTHRVFWDDRNCPWEVRAIRPPDTERRARLLPPAHANGWLLFSLGEERRRLAPLPDDWREASDTQLQRWWSEAYPVQPWNAPRRTTATD